MMPKKPEDELNKERESAEAKEPKANSAALEKELEEAKKQAAEYLASWQRSQADFANYRRRMVQEQQDRIMNANASLFCDILPVVDDLELALTHMPEEQQNNSWVEGVKLVERKFKAILEKQGVKPVCALGMAFDPALHEAIKQEKGPEGSVIAEVQKGYTLNDKLLRPSRVIVGKGEEVENPEDAGGGG
jgi:molecular chaperone GrpE